MTKTNLCAKWIFEHTEQIFEELLKHTDVYCKNKSGPYFFIQFTDAWLTVELLTEHPSYCMLMFYNEYFKEKEN